MALGIKSKNVKTKNEYTIEEFFEAIKNYQFSAGQPTLNKNIILFPALDSQNQVSIVKNCFGIRGKKFLVQKIQQYGVENLVKNAALNSLTHGIFGFGTMVGNNAKECERLVEVTAKEIENLNV